jgi:2'-5' RNA ligase
MSGIIDEFNAGWLFLAVSPDAETAARMYRTAETLRRARNFQGALIRPQRLHITLFFLGDWREHIVRMACEAAAEIKTPPFDVSFDRTASFKGRLGNHAYVLLGDSGLNRLAAFRQMLGVAMTKNGLRQWAKPDFTPHVTLLYDRRQVEEQPIEPVSWTVREFVLIHSRHGHTHLARWPLRG